eukprot:12295604-Prorocentrum_lima.AAC.1
MVGLFTTTLILFLVSLLFITFLIAFSGICTRLLGLALAFFLFPCPYPSLLHRHRRPSLPS